MFTKKKMIVEHFFNLLDLDFNKENKKLSDGQ